MVTAQNTARQPKPSMMKLPVSGARIGETENTSMSIDISLAASLPVCRSRTTARGTTMPGLAPKPCRTRKAISHSMVGRKCGTDAAGDEQHQAGIEQRLAAIHVRKRTDDDLAESHGKEKDQQAHLHRHGAGLQIRADRGKRGKIHVDGERTDGGQQAEHDRDAEEIGGHDVLLSERFRPRGGTSVQGRFIPRESDSSRSIPTVV